MNNEFQWEKLVSRSEKPICNICAEYLNITESVIYYNRIPVHLKCFREQVKDQIERKLCRDDGNPKPGASRLIFLWSEIEKVIEVRQMNNKESVIVDQIFNFKK